MYMLGLVACLIVINSSPSVVNLSSQNARANEFQGSKDYRTKKPRCRCQYRQKNTHANAWRAGWLKRLWDNCYKIDNREIKLTKQPFHKLYAQWIKNYCREQFSKTNLVWAIELQRKSVLQINFVDFNVSFRLFWIDVRKCTHLRHCNSVDLNSPLDLHSLDIKIMFFLSKYRKAMFVYSFLTYHHTFFFLATHTLAVFLFLWGTLEVMLHELIFNATMSR